MSTLYPTLDTEMESDSVNFVPGSAGRTETEMSDRPEEIEIVLQVPPDLVQVSAVHSDGHITEMHGPLTIYDSEPLPYVQIDGHRLNLSEGQELFCLHAELEMFVFGGEQGPIRDTDFHIVLKLINAPDDLLIDLTCVFMSNCSYKNLFVDETKFQEKDFGDKVSSAIIYSADGLSKGINWAGEKTKGFLSSGAENYTQKYPQTETPTQISSGVQKGMQYASTGSKYVAKGTGYVASAIGSAATYVGKHIATKIDEKYGSSTDPNSASRKTWRQAGKIASGVLAGYGKVWSALETSGKSVAVASRDASTVVVKHRHGDQAGNVTYNAMNVGVNMTKTFFHVEDMGMKKICKNIAKSTGKEYLQMHLDKRSSVKNVAPPSRPPPIAQ